MYEVRESSLTAVADAIRAKTGRADKLVFPDKFVSEIGKIEGSGNVAYTNEQVTEIGEMAFWKCQWLGSVDCANVTKVKSQAFTSCESLTRVSLPAVTALEAACFTGCTALTSVEMPLLETTGASSFSGCSALEKVRLPALTVLGNSDFSRCTALETVVLDSATSIQGYSFQYSSALKTLVLGAESVCTLMVVGAFNGTPFAEGGAGGTIYVPKALIESYKAADVWSTLYSYGTVEFVAIEGSAYE